MTSTLMGYDMNQDQTRAYIQQRVDIDENGCWVWRQSKRNGYGRFCLHKKSGSAHIASYEAFVGRKFPDKQINHKCHNRSCCNPEHLYEGTQKENVQDMKNANRSNYLRGEADGNSKITEDVAMKIYASIGIARHIASRYGVSISLVYAIKHKKIWKHIHE